MSFCSAFKSEGGVLLAVEACMSEPCWKSDEEITDTASGAHLPELSLPLARQKFK